MPTYHTNVFIPAFQKNQNSSDTPRILKNFTQNFHTSPNNFSCARPTVLRLLNKLFLALSF
ncbi:hypothetical protein D3C87_1099030 [compost metagenome]